MGLVRTKKKVEETTVVHVKTNPPSYDEFKGLNKRKSCKEGFADYYLPEYSRAAYEVCVLYGSDEITLAKLFGVTPQIIKRWRAKYPDFEESITKATDIFLKQNVERALVKLACGFTKTVKTVTKFYGKDKQYNGRQETTTEMYYPPDYKSIELLLTNRNPERWKKTAQVEFNNGTLNIENKFNIDLSKMGKDDIQALLRIAKSAQIENAELAELVLNEDDIDNETEDE